MHDYEHTQPGTLIRYAVGIIALFLGVVGAVLVSQDNEAGYIVILVVAIQGFVLSMFHSLTVSVDANEVVARFGIGLICLRYITSDIESVEQVRNPWYYGWGIKKYPGGWLYNVSGLDAVELVLKDGRKRRIGTDEPETLVNAIEAVIDR